MVAGHERDQEASFQAPARANRDDSGADTAASPGRPRDDGPSSATLLCMDSELRASAKT
jgi:hypothetical protein